MTAGQHRLFSTPQEQTTTDDTFTPAWVFDLLGITYDLDVCAPPGGIPWIPATRYFTQADDGLTQPWQGRVWMNPPFSQPKPWIQRFINHHNGITIFPISTGRWLTDLWGTADGFHIVRPPFAFHGYTTGLPIPLGFAAFSDECVEAISRLGPVRKLP